MPPDGSESRFGGLENGRRDVHEHLSILDSTNCRAAVEQSRLQGEAKTHTRVVLVHLKMRLD